MLHIAKQAGLKALGKIIVFRRSRSTFCEKMNFADSLRVISRAAKIFRKSSLRLP
jgi:hypothetical protein